VRGKERVKRREEREGEIVKVDSRVRVLLSPSPVYH